MKTRIVAVLLVLSLIGAGMAMAGCQKGSSNNIVELTSSASDTSSEASDEPTSSEEASSTPELSVNSSGEVVDSKGEVVSGYEVSSTGDIISSTGTVVVPASSANATSSTAAQAPANSTSATGSKPASSASKASASSTHTHSYKSTVIAPTCTAQGYTNHKCSCGNSYQDSKTAALGHSYGDWVITKSATTTNEGTQTRTCSRCGATESQSIPKIVQTSKWDAAATPSNAKLVAERTLYYINEYRKAQGSSTATSLPNMTAYAEYRSRQLVTNFSHSATDEQAAAAALQYGYHYTREYLDSIGCPNDPEFWQAQCGEAIGQSGMSLNVESIDDLAKRIATMFKNSGGHWAYVGNTVNIYISVGITRTSGYWYSDVCTTNTNQYG